VHAVLAHVAEDHHAAVIDLGAGGMVWKISERTSGNAGIVDFC